MKRTIVWFAPIALVIGGVTVPALASAATLTVPAQYPTIQAAIDAARPGDTVQVAAGTYTEQLSIDESLTLLGAGAAHTFIKAPSTLVADPDGNMDVVEISGSATVVNLSGFTVEGPGPGGCDTINYGIYVRTGATANIKNNTVANIKDTPFSGCQNGVAIQVGLFDLNTVLPVTSGSATIADNTIVGYQKNGITIDNGSHATVTGNTITGAGQTTVIAQNGIQVSFDASADVSNNHVSGDSYIGTAPALSDDNVTKCPTENYFSDCWQASGILLYDAAPTTLISGNEVTESDLGVALYNDNEPFYTAIPYVLEGNTLLKNYGYGMTIDSANASSTQNVFNGNPVGLLVTDSSADATATSDNDLFENNGVNNEGLSDNNLFFEDLIVETSALHLHFPTGPIHFPGRL